MKNLNTFILAALSCGLFATGAQAAEPTFPRPCSAAPVQANGEGGQVHYDVRIVRTNAGQISELYHGSFRGIFGDPTPFSFNSESYDFAGRSGSDAKPANKLDFLNVTILPVSYNQATGFVASTINVEQGGSLNPQPSIHTAKNCMELGSTPSAMLLNSHGNPDEIGGWKTEAFISAKPLTL